MKRIAVISAILENPEQSQVELNALVASFKGIVKGRMGLPMPEHGISVITIVLAGELDEINSLTGRIGALKDVQVKTSISKKEI
ncbi:MAG: TM1266 family iron-only hydrogenase system putative regulator [Burkholderiales bacterium]|jgi:putative iron-only hydrogenase system regulator